MDFRILVNQFILNDTQVIYSWNTVECRYFRIILFSVQRLPNVKYMLSNKETFFAAENVGEFKRLLFLGEMVYSLLWKRPAVFVG